jgi:hypothetical protein
MTVVIAVIVVVVIIIIIIIIVVVVVISIIIIVVIIVVVIVVIIIIIIDEKNLSCTLHSVPHILSLKGRVFFRRKPLKKRTILNPGDEINIWQ